MVSGSNGEAPNTRITRLPELNKVSNERWIQIGTLPPPIVNVTSGFGGVGRIEHQHIAVRSMQDDLVHPDFGEQLVGQGLVELAGWVREQRQGRDMRRRHVILEIGHAIARDRRHEDQHFAQHHKEDRQQQKTCGQAAQEHCRHSISRNARAGGRAAECAGANKVGV